jgi:hypothetical protein
MLVSVIPVPVKGIQQRRVCGAEDSFVSSINCSPATQTRGGWIPA